MFILTINEGYKKERHQISNIPSNHVPIMPTWTNDPVRDEMAYQSYLEDCRGYDGDDDYNPWEDGDDR